MNIHNRTAKKLHDEIIAARMKYELKGESISAHCRVAAKHYKGYVRTQLERIAKLGPVEAERMTRIYLQEWDEYKNALL